MKNPADTEDTTNSIEGDESKADTLLEDVLYEDTDKGDNQEASKGADEDPTDTVDAVDETKAEDEAVDETKAADAEDESTEEAELKAPEKYEFTPPEGIEYHPATIEAFEKAARKMDLSQEDANQLLETVTPVMQQANIEAAAAVHESWIAETKSDKEIGGAKLDGVLTASLKTMDTFGTPELQSLLDTTGLGSNPHVLKLLNKIGQAISEDRFVGGDPVGDEVSANKKSNDEIGEVLYGGTAK